MTGSNPKACDAKVTSTEPLVRPALVEKKNPGLEITTDGFQMIKDARWTKLVLFVHKKPSQLKHG